MKLLKRFTYFSLVIFSHLLFTACDELLQIANEVGVLAPTDAEIGQGLKAALDKGIGFAVNTLGQEGGYFNDPLVKIPFPPEAQFAADALTTIGLGSLVEKFEEKLNRGAEEGAKQALSIFATSIKALTLDDVRNILLGADNAATEYFKRTTREQLFATYSPKIRETLDKVNATTLWEDVTTKYNSIPLTGKKIETDLVKYATDRALDGLFLKIAVEEKKIRNNAVERTSEILRKVFGYAESQKSAQNTSDSQ